MAEPAPNRFSTLASSVADGEPVDWAALESGAASAEERSLLSRFKIIADVAKMHATGVIVGSQLNLPGTLSSDADDDVPVYAPGSTWGHLRIHDVIGSGRYGVVYRAWDPKLEREVALKLLKRRELSRKSEVIDEARLMARVHHQNVVTVYGADSRDGQVGLWMQFVRGRTLEAELAAAGPFSEERLVAVARELCDALTAVHQAGLVHRDVKPQNVLRDDRGRAVLGDFGTGRVADEGDWGVAGTPLFLAPEILAGGPASERSDIYALGVSLYHLATTKYPIYGRSITDLREAHERYASVKPLASLRPDLKGPIANVIDRALLSPDDRWRTAADLKAALPDGSVDVVPMRVAASRHRLGIAAAVVAVLLAVTVGRQWVAPAAPPAADIEFSQRPWVLLASFDNQTGDPSLDGLLDYALERELSGSPRFRVASRARVDDTLKLMQRPVDERLDRETAREVALRDGQIGTVIDSRVERIGAAIVLSAAVIDVTTGAGITTVTEEVADVATLQPSIRRLSSRLREVLGEAAGSIRASEQQLEQVTTPSLKALRLYSEAWSAGERDHWPAALTLARQAVQEDPQFAAAHTWLAWALMRNQADRDEYVAAAARGEQLSGSASDWERMWIRGSHFGLQGRNAEAIAEYEALLRIRPNHFWAVNNLVLAHRRTGGDEKALGALTRLLELRPHDYNSLSLAFDTARRLRRVDEAKAYARRIKAAGLYNRGPSGDAWVFDAVIAWVNGDTTTLLRELRRIETEALTYPQELRDAVLARASMLWLAAGRPGDASNTLGRASNNVDAQLGRATIAYATGDTAAARREAIAVDILTVPAGGTNVSEVMQSLLAMWLVSHSASAREARAFYDALFPHARRGQEPQSSATANLLASELAYAEGRTADVVKGLSPQGSWDILRDSANFRAAETLTEVLTRQGDFAGAAKALERSQAAARLGSMDAAYWQMRCQLRLAELYQRLGRGDAAASIARTLSRQLAEAEPGFPMLVRVDAVLASASLSR